MKKNELRDKIYSKIDEIPTLPTVLPKLLSLIESDRSAASDIAEAISSDPALASKTLKVANSAYYGFSQTIATLEKAVPLLGFNMVRSLALSIGVIHSLSSGKNTSHFTQEGLWLHSLAVAEAMQELARRFGKGDHNEHLFIVGLLHDIGKIVLNQYFKELFEQALEAAISQKNSGLYMAERRIIGLDHADVGAMLLERWKFPATVRDPIAVHHQEDIPEGTNANDVAMLKIANVLPQILGMGSEGNPTPPEICDRDLKSLGINENDLEDIKGYLQSIEDRMYSFFNAIH